MTTRDNYVSVSVAAREIGITSGRLRQMIRANQCAAYKFEDERFPSGYSYEIPLTEIERLKEVTHKRGRPRTGDSEKPAKTT